MRKGASSVTVLRNYRHGVGEGGPLSMGFSVNLSLRGPKKGFDSKLARRGR